MQGFRIGLQHTVPIVPTVPPQGTRRGFIGTGGNSFASLHRPGSGMGGTVGRTRGTLGTQGQQLSSLPANIETL